MGDLLTIEVLEGRRLTRTAPLVGLAEDFAGVAAYMDLHALNRLLGEGDIITGASFTIDALEWRDFLRELKGIPRVSWVAVKESLRANFRETTAASINVIQTIYLIFAVIVAFGVVYNNARISLAERARELATLRVIGFSRREVGTVLVTELVILALVAVPIGLLIGTGFASAILQPDQYRNRATAPRAKARQLRLRGPGRHGRLGGLSRRGPPQTEPTRPRRRPESPGIARPIRTSNPSHEPSTTDRSPPGQRAELR